MNIAAKPLESEDDVPSGLRIPDPKEVFKGELVQSGEWVVANISNASFWPIASQKAGWRGADIWILPIMKGFYPAVAMKVPPGKSRLACEELVMRFLSTLSRVRGARLHGGRWLVGRQHSAPYGP